MADAKTKFTREELTEAHDQFAQRHCVLCQGVGVGTNEIEHDDECVLADDLVESVQLIRIRDLTKLCPKCEGGGKVGHWYGPDEREVIECDRCGGSGRRSREDICTHPDLLRHHGCKLCSVKDCPVAETA